MEESFFVATKIESTPVQTRGTCSIACTKEDDCPGGVCHSDADCPQWEINKHGSFTGVKNGTCDMMGNVLEWNESRWGEMVEETVYERVLRGGNYGSGESDLRSSYFNSAGDGFESEEFGFRIAAIPEPSSFALLGIGLLCVGFVTGRRKIQRQQASQR